MKRRYLFDSVKVLALDRKKMAFISGPRQVGKTTFAKSLKSEFDLFLYKNWDESSFRKGWTRSPGLITAELDLTNIRKRPLLALDEIHKSKGWKTRLKGLFDETGDRLRIVVTGSARLNVFKKGGDSLMGRYLNFRLHPLSYGEILAHEIISPDKWKANLIQGKNSDLKSDSSVIDKLLRFSGFPEPYFEGSDKIMNIWRQGRNEKIVREDLRDISRIPELSQVEMLTSLLPDKVGTPLSVQSLREDLEVSFDTVKRWLKYLEELYYFFEIKPWSKSVPRSLKKEAKIYLYDWTEIENPGHRFENLVAATLLKACHLWTDTGEGEFNLHYLRNKEKQEVDFLITKQRKPWLMVEAKIAEKSPDIRTAKRYREYLGCPFVQVVLEDDISFIKDEVGVLSATAVFANLP